MSHGFVRRPKGPGALIQARAHTPGRSFRSHLARRLAPRLAAALALLVPLPCLAAPGPEGQPYYVRLGVVGAIFEPTAKFSIVGNRVDNASISNSSNVTVAGEIGAYVTRHIALSVTGGLPPETTITGTGVASPLGTLGKARYGIAFGAASYHLDLGRFHPWIGGGPAYMMVFSTVDRAIESFHVSNQVGGGVQIGTDYMLTKQFGLYADATQFFLHTDARGRLGGAPITAKVTLNPVVLQLGATLKF